MTWAGYWLPQLISWGGSALVGAVVTIFLRRVLRVLAGQQLQTGEHAQQAAISASQAGEDTSVIRSGQVETQRRLRAVEGTLEGMRDGVSASLGHRAQQDLRFRRVEQQLQQLQAGRRGSSGHVEGQGRVPAEGAGTGGGAARDGPARVGDDGA